MNTMTPHDEAVRGGADVLAVGFATTVSMWAAGYFLRMPVETTPPWALALVMGLAMLAGGFYVGCATRRGWVGGLIAGLVTASLNLIILGGALRQPDGAGPSPLTWIPGTLAITAIVMAIMAAIGATLRPTDAVNVPRNWTGRFAFVAALTTFLLLIAGGLVTGHEAGLAVPDWPNSYGYNMLLYPFARMTGNIYYEHTHRLYGMLVGVTTITLAVHLWMVEDRKWIKWLVFGAIAAVVAQGLMGAARVLEAQSHGGVQVATAANETDLSDVLRVAHGVFGQLFFALMISIAVFTSTAWRNVRQRIVDKNAGSDQTYTLLLMIGLMVQLVLGACVRHLHVGVYWHISLASVLFMASVIIGMRLWGLHGDKSTLLKRLGIALIVVVTLQIGLGVASLVVTNLSQHAGKPLVSDAVLTTMHQATGAALLALAVTAMLMTRRVMQQPRVESQPAESSVTDPT